MKPDDPGRLNRQLQGAGWRLDGDALYAPNGTMWLDADDPTWSLDLLSFRNRIQSRVNQLQADRTAYASEDADEDWQAAFEDAAGLLGVLEKLLEQGS